MVARMNGGVDEYISRFASSIKPYEMAGGNVCLSNEGG